MMKRVVLAAGVALSLGLAACQDSQYSSKHLSPIPPATMSLMAQKGMSKADPIVIRAYKKESEMEVWKRGTDGRYALLKTFPICRWSGQLGPKVREGDRQAPEGFYTITPGQMNPNSSFYLSFDTGYPNTYDRAHGRTGSYLMVHGNCSSRGCFAMTDEAIAEVYAIARESFSGGQRTFQFQSYPFRMTAENLAKHRADPHIAFWKNLKEGSDYFEALREEPKVAVCGKRYTFGGAEVADGSCAPQVPTAVAEKRAKDDQAVAELVAKGTPAIKLVYEDGGQHHSFRETMMAASGSSESSFAVLDARPRRNLGDVSRPDALAMGPREILLDGAGKPRPDTTALAFAETTKTAAPQAEPKVASVATAKPAKSETARTETAKAAPAKSGTVVARTEAQPASAAPAAAAPVQTASAGESRSIYQRMVGLFGSEPKPESPPAAAAPAPAPTVPAAPARRQSTAPTPSQGPAPAKPQAASPAPEKRASLQRPAILLGAQAPLSAAEGFTKVN
ncbi:MAG TPA: murein L,D-transpeptidase family protein [Beijerinckiaceae bacterium]|jgi:murein L,D-transpeptidase YafK